MRWPQALIHRRLWRVVRDAGFRRSDLRSDDCSVIESSVWEIHCEVALLWYQMARWLRDSWQYCTAPSNVSDDENIWKSDIGKGIPKPRKRKFIFSECSPLFVLSSLLRLHAPLEIQEMHLCDYGKNTCEIMCGAIAYMILCISDFYGIYSSSLMCHPACCSLSSWVQVHSQINDNILQFCFVQILA